MIFREIGQLDELPLRKQIYLQGNCALARQEILWLLKRYTIGILMPRSTDLVSSVLAMTDRISMRA
jgi:hypothetical protein